MHTKCTQSAHAQSARKASTSGFYPVDPPSAHNFDAHKANPTNLTRDNAKITIATVHTSIVAPHSTHHKSRVPAQTEHAPFNTLHATPARPHPDHLTPYTLHATRYTPNLVTDSAARAARATLH